MSGVGWATQDGLAFSDVGAALQSAEDSSTSMGEPWGGVDDWLHPRWDNGSLLIEGANGTAVRETHMPYPGFSAVWALCLGDGEGGCFDGYGQYTGPLWGLYTSFRAASRAAESAWWELYRMLDNPPWGFCEPPSAAFGPEWEIELFAGRMDAGIDARISQECLCYAREHGRVDTCSITLMEVEGMTASVRLYERDGETAIVTDAVDESSFIEATAAVLAELCRDANGDSEKSLRAYLPQVLDVACKLRGYKAPTVHERRLLTVGTGILDEGALKVEVGTSPLFGPPPDTTKAD